MPWTLDLLVLLVLLVLMGHFSFSSCHLYQYHFIRENKTWDEAQRFCRETYTDLATVSDMTDMKRLSSSTENQDEAWIGLHSYPGTDNRKWYWSLPGLEFNASNTRWFPGEPLDYDGHIKNCVQMGHQQWFTGSCSVKLTFICYNETTQSNKFPYITTAMTWPQAQNYCRTHYTDLVSGLDQLEDQTMKNSSDGWFGLFRDTWRWSDGTNSSFRNWQRLDDLVDGQSNKTCATVLNPAGTWSSAYCGEHKPFYCYEEAAPRKKLVVRVKLSTDPSVAMTDPDVTESMWKQMEAAFRDKALSVKLSWRKLPEELTTTEEEPQRQESINGGCSVIIS